MKINLNDVCIVKLTNFGNSLYEAHYKRSPKPDEHGYVRFQLWELFQFLGPHMYLGMNEVPFERNEIEFM